MVSSDTFDAIVTAFDWLSLHNRYYDRKEWCDHFSKDSQNEHGCLRLLRNMLIKANIDSLHARYKDPEDMYDASELYDTPFEQVGEVNQWLTQRQYGKVLHLMACFDYQSCEVNDWEKTDAYRFLQTIEKLILAEMRHSVPDDQQPSWGSYARPADNAGPVSLMSLLESR